MAYALSLRFFFKRKKPTDYLEMFKLAHSNMLSSNLRGFKLKNLL